MDSRPTATDTDRIDHLEAKFYGLRLLVLTLAGVITGALLVAAWPAPTAVAGVPAAPACDWDTELRDTLHLLGENPEHWTAEPQLVDSQDRPAYGLAHWDVTASVSRQAPCHLVRGVVSHEWAHLQQMRLLGTDTAHQYYRNNPDAMERVADCVALELGAFYAPYVAAEPCTNDEITLAHQLIGEVAR
jgi:hypothetical protein